MRTKEEEINKRKAEMFGKMNEQMTRVQQQARHLEGLRKELEALEDPTKKEVAELRKRIEAVDRELRPMKSVVDRKEKELKELSKSVVEKSHQKAELVSQLFDIVTESERVRMAKLEELNRALQAMEAPANGSADTNPFS